ncbi:TPA: desulfoferrodoxin [Candidatus Marinimicrobia bacterium]|nr:desulfoferrodoxin [Candidatus Neomarinimicrobiota bacterium]HBY17992.1 desulfoferrodoxin [Candidatus Neomarinimicrobiota bacterium]
MPVQGDVLFSPKSKTLVEVIHGSGSLPECDGFPMKKLEAKTEDSKHEKHVPYVEAKDDGVLVKIGQNEEHPMTEEHYIYYIEIRTGDMSLRKYLKPGDKPQAWFPVDLSEIVEVLEWCNIHGLWKA